MAQRRGRTRAILLAVGAALLLALCVAGVVYRRHGHEPTSQALPTDLAQWQSYEGSWASRNGVLTDRTGGRGDKLMTGDTTLNDFIYRADVRFDSDRDFEFGDAGLVLRASNITVGTDSLYGYYVGIRPGMQMLKLGRMQDDYTDFALRTLDAPVAIHAWYHLLVQVRGCTFFVQVQDDSGRTIGVMHVDDPDCVIRAGQLGLRSYGMIASWRALSVQQLP